MMLCSCRCSTARATVADQPGGRLEGESRPGTGDPLGQALALDVLHRKIVLAVVLAHVVDLRDIGVPHVGGGPGLHLEAADVLGRGQVRGEDHFHGHDAVQGLLPRLVDHSHPATADLRQQFVGAEIAGRL